MGQRRLAVAGRSDVDPGTGGDLRLVRPARTRGHVLPGEGCVERARTGASAARQRLQTTCLPAGQRTAARPVRHAWSTVVAAGRRARTWAHVLSGQTQDAPGRPDSRRG